MANETNQILELILSKLENLENGQEYIKREQEGMKKEQESMRKEQESMRKEQESMRKEQKSMRKEQESMKTRQDEIYEVAKAIEHSNQTRKAEIDDLIHKVAHVEGTINGVSEFIQDRKIG